MAISTVIGRCGSIHSGFGSAVQTCHKEAPRQSVPSRRYTRGAFRELPGCRSIRQRVPARMPRSGLELPASMSASLRKRPRHVIPERARRIRLVSLSSAPAAAAAADGGRAGVFPPTLIDIIWLLGIYAIAPTIQPTCRVRLGQQPAGQVVLVPARHDEDDRSSRPQPRQQIGLPPIPMMGTGCSASARGSRRPSDEPHPEGLLDSEDEFWPLLR